MEIKNIEQFLKYYSRIKQRTRRLLEIIPEDQIEWTYRTGKFTIGDLFRHIANIERYLYAETVATNRNLYNGCGENYAKGVQSILAHYDKMYAESIAIFENLTEDDLQKKCKTSFGTEISTWKWLRALVEHEIHHRAEIYLYLEMNGIKTPPLFGLTSEEVMDKNDEYIRGTSKK
ncbi:MAG: DinB family protein [Flavobacteriales bacterium]|jgi:uncharacterized damage-inducible protein DinB|nr:DinB family protein [Flavobacteriales bacterium]